MAGILFILVYSILFSSLCYYDYSKTSSACLYMDESILETCQLLWVFFKTLSLSKNLCSNSSGWCINLDISIRLLLCWFFPVWFIVVLLLLMWWLSFLVIFVSLSVHFAMWELCLLVIDGVFLWRLVCTFHRFYWNISATFTSFHIFSLCFFFNNKIISAEQISDVRGMSLNFDKNHQLHNFYSGYR